MSITGVMNESALSGLGAGSEASSVVMDEDAFRAFYDLTSRSVWVYLARVTGDRQVADDLLQETYYRFFKLGSVHADDAHRRNSLFCIATNVARDVLRKRKRSLMAPFPAEDAEALAVNARIAEQFEGRTDLERAMARLKPVQREMLWLAYALGSSHDEIAEMLGLQSRSIRTLLFRARRKLAGLLQGDESMGARP